MSGGDNPVRVEKNIRRRQGGTYCVSVSVDWEERRKSFETLEEARAWRDEMIASRPKRRTRHGIPALSARNTADEDVRREVIASSPKSTRVINGRKFTVVHLPPTMEGIAA